MRATSQAVYQTKCNLLEKAVASTPTFCQETEYIFTSKTNMMKTNELPDWKTFSEILRGEDKYEQHRWLWSSWIKTKRISGC